MTWVALAVWNVAVWAVWRWDKFAAVTRRRRVPERVLLRLAWAGGAPGAAIAIALSRHKTRHRPIVASVAAACVVQAGALAWWWM